MFGSLQKKRIRRPLVELNHTNLNLSFYIIEENNVPLNSESEPTMQLDEILGNVKPLIYLLQDETNAINSTHIGNSINLINA